MVVVVRGVASEVSVGSGSGSDEHAASASAKIPTKAARLIVRFII